MFNTKYKKEMGKNGEDRSVEFLINNGFEIMARNYQKRVGEIDIIAFKKGIIHFFEVKSVSRETFNLSLDTFHRAEDNVTRQKIKKIEKVATIFLAEKGFSDKEIQIDLLTVYFIRSSKGEYFINHIPNINFT